ncbi:hypothetical protein IDH44_22030 [Paenibacillus sp. IB182496]|uniref:Gp5/Type VI secretion system Vgr protein OB-fold domain-containing protein n=2 Tax=Paenibacillus sabuli TaxID=2772509 RepID=A0A927BYY8_9BACL|nr:hypothetical protein [Paenibacillus sabuli]
MGMQHQTGGAGQQKMYGVLLAVVTNNQDPEKLGRVKLKYPIREIEQESDWARVITFMGGKDRGGLFTPEVGDEVLVAFHMGDFNQPYVIGSLWNDTDKAPAPAEKNDIRKIRSRSGHELIFGDKSGDERLTVQTKKGHVLEMTDKDGKVKLSDSTGNHSLLIEGSGSGKVTLASSGTKIEITAQGDVSITSNKQITLKSTQLKLEASATMSLKASASLDLKSDGIINIKGSMVKIN